LHFLGVRGRGERTLGRDVREIGRWGVVARERKTGGEERGERTLYLRV
jgi:hypothetical protein